MLLEPRCRSGTCNTVTIFGSLRLSKRSEQTDRRLFMDGQCINLAFICTHTDDCEATETMHDHQEVAKNVPGLWEKIKVLSNCESLTRSILVASFKLERCVYSYIGMFCTAKR